MSFFIAEWDPGYYPDIRTANTRQQATYQKIKRRLGAGKIVDVGENDAYLYYYNIELRSAMMAAMGPKEISRLRKANEDFIRNYSLIKPKVTGYFYPDLIFADLLLYLNRDNDRILYDLDHLVNFCLSHGHGTNVELALPAYITAGNFTSDSYLDPSIMQVFAPTSLRGYMTKVGKEHEAEVLKTLYGFLRADFEYSSTNYLYKMYDFTDGVVYLDQYGAYCCAALTEVPKDAARVIGGLMIPLENEVRLKAFLKSSVREAENLFRSSVGIQEVGQGWVSETLLFRRVEAAFPDTEVIQHASPSFLGRQHYDVYIPKYKIALEYQGDQHYSPVDFFGGEEAFRKNRERDARKKTLSDCNGVYLIEVFPGYAIADVIIDICDKIQTRSNRVIDPQLAIGLSKSVSNTLPNADTATRYSMASRKVVKSVQTIIDEDALLTRKALFLVEKINLQPKVFEDPLTTLGRDKYERLMKLYIQTDKVLYDKDVQDRISTLEHLLSEGLTLASIFGELARCYHSLGQYRQEMSVMLRAQKEYGFDFTDYIKRLLKGHSETFEDLFAGFNS